MKYAFQKSGFTLVELLLVMAIIAVLASLSLAIVNDAQFDAHANTTRSRITMVQSILQQKLDSYARLRVPINLNDYGLNLQKQREYRRRIITDIINTEMPRRAQNIPFEFLSVTLATMREAIYPSQQLLVRFRNDGDLTGVASAMVDDLVEKQPTALGTRFTIPGQDPASNTAAYPENGSSYSMADVTFNSTDPTTFPTLAARRTLSEYLYSILESSEFNGISAVESLGQRAFDDTDNDGFLEVVDSWGDPICFQFEADYDGDGDIDAFGLDPGLNGPGIPIRNLSIRLLSTGKGIETITN